MSRTDKDAPAWVRGNNAPNRTASHHPDCDAAPDHHYSWRGNDRSHRCDIDDPHTHGWRNACTWWADDRNRFPYTSPPGHANRNLYFTRKDRAHVRDTLHDAVRDYNAHADTDVATDDYRSNRRGMFGGGYWD